MKFRLICPDEAFDLFDGNPPTLSKFPMQRSFQQCEINCLHIQTELVSSPAFELEVSEWRDFPNRLFHLITTLLILRGKENGVYQSFISIQFKMKDILCPSFSKAFLVQVVEKILSLHPNQGFQARPANLGNQISCPNAVRDAFHP